MGTTDVAVVGAGPAGVAAALAAAAQGLCVTLIEESFALGGQYLAGACPAPGTACSPAEVEGRALLAALASSTVALRLSTVVWSLSRSPDGGHVLELQGPAGPESLRAAAVVLATGAREQVVPFPGWTLPGVTTVGGAGRMLRTQGVLPGRRVVVAGSGPLLLRVACELVGAGARVLSVMEATTPFGWVRHAGAPWGQADRLSEGWRYLEALRREGVPVRLGRTVVRAFGADGVASVVSARLDGKGRPVRGTLETLEADSLCLGFGLIPNDELARQAGCAMAFDPAWAGWRPHTDHCGETTIPGVFAAGEAAGVGGAEAAVGEGRLAGLAAALRTARPLRSGEAALAGELDRAEARRRGDRSFRSALNTLFTPRVETFGALATDDVVLCRCEEITAGEVRRALAAGATTVAGLKSWCRVGHGPCQGRTCGPILAAFLASERAGQPDAAGAFSARPPVKPLSLGALARSPAAIVPSLPEPLELPRPVSRRAAPARVGAAADVVVVGGGIVGAACAYYLCEAGLKTHLVERGFPAAGTSGACDGIVLLWDKAPGPELALGVESARLWRELSRSLEVDIEYARKGTLMLVEGDASHAATHRKAAEMTAAGVRNEYVDGQGLRELEPELAPDLVGSFYFPDDAVLDPRRATLAFLGAARRRGLTVHFGADVLSIERSPGGRVNGVVTSRGRLATEHVVNAAGVWSAEVARMAGSSLPVRPRKGHVLVTEKVPGLLRHTLMEGAYAATVGAAQADLQTALVAEPTESGTLLLGSSRQFAGFDRTASPGVMAAVAARAVRFLPRLAGVQVLRSYAGLRPWSPDHRPFIGPHSDVPGFYAATGHEGAGICLAPVTGRLIAEWVQGERPEGAAWEVLPGRPVPA